MKSFRLQLKFNGQKMSEDRRATLGRVMNDIFVLISILAALKKEYCMLVRCTEKLGYLLTCHVYTSMDDS